MTKYNCALCGCWFVTEKDLEYHYEAHKMYGNNLPSMIGMKKTKKTIAALVAEYRDYIDNYGRGYQNKIDSFKEISYVFRYDDPEWIKLSKAMRAKANYQCQICDKKTKELQTHHLIPIKHAPEKAFDPENLIVLCNPCHDKIHEDCKEELRDYAAINSEMEWVDYDAKENHTCDECGGTFYGPLYQKYCKECYNHLKGDYH